MPGLRLIPDTTQTPSDRNQAVFAVYGSYFSAAYFSVQYFRMNCASFALTVQSLLMSPVIRPMPPAFQETVKLPLSTIEFSFSSFFVIPEVSGAGFVPGVISVTVWQVRKGLSSRLTL